MQEPIRDIDVVSAAIFDATPAPDVLALLGTSNLAALAHCVKSVIVALSGTAQHAAYDCLLSYVSTIVRHGRNEFESEALYDEIRETLKPYTGQLRQSRTVEQMRAAYAGLCAAIVTLATPKLKNALAKAEDDTFELVARFGHKIPFAFLGAPDEECVALERTGLAKLASELGIRPLPGEPANSVPTAHELFVMALKYSRRAWLNLTADPDSMHQTECAVFKRAEVAPFIAELGNYTVQPASSEDRIQALERENLALHRRIAELEAARMAYAREFPLTEDGEPDVGNIHANIRKLKARVAQAS